MNHNIQELAQFISTYAIPDGLIRTVSNGKVSHDLRCVVKSNITLKDYEHILNTYTNQSNQSRYPRNITLNLSTLGIDVFEVFRHCDIEVLRTLGESMLHVKEHSINGRVPGWIVNAGKVVSIR